MHELGIQTDDFYNNKQLAADYELLAIDYSSEIEFITAIEHKRYPMYGFTFHPEFFLLEFETYNKINIEQSEKTARIARSFSKALVDIGRKNSNRFNNT